MDEEFDFLVTTYNIMKDYVPANQMQGAADHLMGVIVDTMDELDLKEFVAATGCTYLKKSHSEFCRLICTHREAQPNFLGFFRYKHGIPSKSKKIKCRWVSICSAAKDH